MYLGTVLLQWLQWYMCRDLLGRFTSFSYQIPDPQVITHKNKSPLLNNGSSPPNGNSTNNLPRGYHFFHSMLAPNSFTMNQQLVAKLPLLPFDSHRKLLQKEPTTCREATVASIRHSSQTPSEGAKCLVLIYMVRHIRK